MKKLTSIIITISLLISQVQAILLPEEREIFTQIQKENQCQNVQEKDIPTILIP
jgi:hypothetical protein